MTSVKVLSEKDFVRRLREQAVARKGEYLGLYSSWLGGYTRDPAFMILPLDDHMVHRGDGVFEALRMESGLLFAWEEHWQRLQASAQAIGLRVLWSEREVLSHLHTLRELCSCNEALIRIFISRGPGSFSVNPYDSEGPQLHLVFTALKSPRPEAYLHGLALGESQWRQKSAPFCHIKSCNYLPNVLMKKEAVDRGLDLTLSFTEEGFLAEGPTENVALLTPEGEWLTPSLDFTLKGTTLLKVMSLAQNLVDKGELKRVDFSPLQREDLRRAQEVMIIGTTWGVMGVSSWEGRPIGLGRSGPISLKLGESLKELSFSSNHAFSLKDFKLDGL